MINKTRRRSSSPEEPKTRVNVTIKGEPAQYLLEMKARGMFVSNADLVIKGIYALYEKTLERDLKAARLETMKSEEV